MLLLAGAALLGINTSQAGQLAWIESKRILFGLPNVRSLVLQALCMELVIPLHATQSPSVEHVYSNCRGAHCSANAA